MISGSMDEIKPCNIKVRASRTLLISRARVRRVIALRQTQKEDLSVVRDSLQSSKLSRKVESMFAMKQASAVLHHE
jgi:hypothetical protein